MYTVTFYSFKGGVGRSLALMNVGLELVKQGNKVLLVDFDLEAPGLTSFDICSSARATKGIIDFVSAYIDDGTAPDVRSFMSECPTGFKGNGALHVMPAGIEESDYGRRLAQIDWSALYQDLDGYLLMEDLKAQWREAIEPDYVLIDSRTGHTEEGGICTRQLADAVVAMFFPNEQNLLGLKGVIEDIRAEGKALKKEISLHFVTSNVPDLDDEDQILFERLNRFKDALNYSSKDLSTIHHYPSLSLLNQEIFVDRRPNSRLANEYRTLVKAIVERNIEDEQGARYYLEALSSSDYESPDGTAEIDKVQQRLERISQIHRHAYDILTLVAETYLNWGELQKAKTILDTVLGSGFSSIRAARAQFRVNLMLDRDEIDPRGLLDMLEVDGANVRDVMSVLEILGRSHPEFQSEVLKSKAFRNLGAERQVFIGQNLIDSPGGTAIAERIFRSSLEHRDEGAESAAMGLALLSISRGQFDEAMKLLGPRESLFTEDAYLPDVFNFAIAEWGGIGIPPQDLFQRFIDRITIENPSRESPNVLQCIAIGHWAIGNTPEAQTFLQRARNAIRQFGAPSFSAWRYSTVPANEFEHDLDDMAQFFSEGTSLPYFLRK